jgi:hypothetical protein
LKKKPPQHPYPWFDLSFPLVQELIPYAIYAAGHEMFNLTFQPKSDAQFLKFGPDGRTEEINTDLLAESIRQDDMRHEVLSGDPLIIEIAHGLMYAPERITALAKLNKAYMSGFTEPHKKWSEVQQARVHMMTACLLLGECDDHRITKKDLWEKTLDLWAHAWIRAHPQKDGIRNYFPDEKLLAATINRLPPVRAEKAEPPRQWKRERVYSSLGLDGIFGARESGRRKNILEQDFREGVQRMLHVADLRNPKLRFITLLRILLWREAVAKIPTEFRNMFEWELTEEAHRALYSIPELKDRGWTQSLIDKFLGEPDVLREHPTYAAPKKLYLRSRALQCEASESFQAAKQKAATRSVSALETASVKRA